MADPETIRIYVDRSLDADALHQAALLAERTLGVPKGKVFFHQEVFPTEGTRENLSLVAQYSDSQTETIALSAGATGVKVEVPNRDMEGRISP